MQVADLDEPAAKSLEILTRNYYDLVTWVLSKDLSKAVLAWGDGHTQTPTCCIYLADYRRLRLKQLVTGPAGTLEEVALPLNFELAVLAD